MDGHDMRMDTVESQHQTHRFQPGGHPVRPNRKSNKIAKLKARGTYRRRNQWRIDKAHAAVVRAADSLAPHLNLSGDELLARIGYSR